MSGHTNAGYGNEIAHIVTPATLAVLLDRLGELGQEAQVDVPGTSHCVVDAAGVPIPHTLLRVRADGHDEGAVIAALWRELVAYCEANPGPIYWRTKPGLHRGVTVIEDPHGRALLDPVTERRIIGREVPYVAASCRLTKSDGTFVP